MPGRPRNRAHNRTYTRRSFIKTSAAAGAALATGPVLAPAVHAQARPIKIGYVSPATGPLAPFAAADEFMLRQFREATKGGLKVGNATRPIEVLLRDSQSNPNRAADVAKTLIVNDKVDLMLVGNTPETTNPVCIQAESEEVATISSLAPWQPWFFGQQGNAAQPRQFNYVYHYFWGLEDVIDVFTNMWSQLDTNKAVGALFPNDADGNAWGDKERGFPPALAQKGYKLVDPGRYQNLTDNFAAQITAFKNASAQIVTGVVLPPDFTTFWKQALQQGFKPRAASVGKAILFPSSVEALARDGHNLSSEVWWTPSHPFKSSINGLTARQLADAYTAATKRQWSQPIGFAHSLYEVALDVLKRTREIGNARATAEAIRATKLDTVVGHIEWNGRGVPPIAAKNVTKTSLVGGQWRVRDGNRYDIVITDNRTAPNIPVGGKMEPIA
jgi:branched-chain amino acid transport system substrate-binding protein